MAQEETFDTPLLRQLLRTGKAGELVAKGIPGGFVLAMRDGVTEQMLVAQRGGARKFKRLDTVAGYLAGIGGRSFSVELGQWTPESLEV